MSTQTITPGVYAERHILYYWNTNSLAYEVATVPAGGGGGGAVTVADGADVAQGTTSDAVWSSGSGTVISLLKKIAGGAASDVTDRSARLLGHVTVDNASLPVTGTFYQATQPVSIAATVNTNTGLTQPLTDTQLRASAVPVSLATAPTTPVTGTFWQATQPVSIATMPSTPVTGTFWQATQPISGSVTVTSAPSTAVTNAGTFAVQAALNAETTKVIGTVNVAAAQTIAVTQATAANLNATVTPPTLTKGTQAATGFSTQDLKDSGRVAISFTAEFSPVAVAEAMLTMSVSKDGATATTGTSYVITSGKRLRLASKSIAVENTLGTSIQRAYLRTRFAATGGALITSPLQANCIAAAAGTVKSVGSNFDDYPDGLEFLGDGTKAIGWSLQAPDWVTASATLKVYVTIICFEY